MPRVADAAEQRGEDKRRPVAWDGDVELLAFGRAIVSVHVVLSAEDGVDMIVTSYIAVNS